MFDFKFITRIGFGEMAWRRLESDNYLLSDRFVMINPMAGVDVNLSRYARIFGEIGYRKISDLNLAGVTEEDFDGVTVKLGIALGLFNFLER